MLYSLARRGDAPAMLRARAGAGGSVHSVIASCAVAVCMALINFVDFLRPRMCWTR